MVWLSQQTNYYFRLCEHHWVSWFALECQKFLYVYQRLWRESIREIEYVHTNKVSAKTQNALRHQQKLFANGKSSFHVILISPCLSRSWYAYILAIKSGVGQRGSFRVLGHKALDCAAPDYLVSWVTPTIPGLNQGIVQVLSIWDKGWEEWAFSQISNHYCIQQHYSVPFSEMVLFKIVVLQFISL